MKKYVYQKLLILNNILLCFKLLAQIGLSRTKQYFLKKWQ